VVDETRVLRLLRRMSAETDVLEAESVLAGTTG